MSNDPFFNEGYGAYEEGVDFDDCPYAEGTDGQYGWRMGWNAADANEMEDRIDAQGN